MAGQIDPDPRRQHVRRQRRARRHRGARRPSRPACSRSTPASCRQWVLTVNGQRLNPLSIDDLQYFESRFFLVPGTGTVYIDAKLSVIRQRAVGDGFHEELTILNHEDEPVDLDVRIDAASDFADLFEIKDALKKLGTYDDGRRGRSSCVSATSARRSVARRPSRRQPRPTSTRTA